MPEPKSSSGAAAGRRRSVMAAQERPAKDKRGLATNADRIQLGTRLREERKSLGWTIDRASEATGVARSTLSKIEGGLMSPTFDMLQKIARGMSLDLARLFDDRAAEGATGRRVIVRKGSGAKIVSSSYQHELLATEISKKKFLPFRSTITARSLEDFGELVTHKGEEFFIVLRGVVVLYTSFYAPTTLIEGDGAYFDSTMGHALIASGPDDAEVLWVTSDDVDPPSLQGIR